MLDETINRQLAAHDAATASPEISVETEIHEVDTYVVEIEAQLALADETLDAVALALGSPALDIPTLQAFIAETTNRRGRGRPKIEGERPWELAGVSRATWYRRGS